MNRPFVVPVMKMLVHSVLAVALMIAAIIWQGQNSCSAKTEEFLADKNAVPSSQDSNMLRSWSIPIDMNIVRPKTSEVRLKDKSEIVCTGLGPHWPWFVFLTRPNEKNFVAVVKCDPNDPAVLKSKGLQLWDDTRSARSNAHGE